MKQKSRTNLVSRVGYPLAAVALFGAGALVGNYKQYSSGLQEGITIGHERGYTAGQVIGREEGYENGLTAGKEEGFSTGYAQAKSDAQKKLEEKLLGQDTYVTIGGKQYLARVDTGAARTCVDDDIIAQLGLTKQDSTGKVYVRNANGISQRLLYPVTFSINGITYTKDVNTKDRDHMDYGVLLGRDILNEYLVDCGQEPLLDIEKKD